MSWLSKLSGKSKGARATATTGGKSGAVPAPMIVIDRHEYQPAEFAIGSFRIRPYDGDLIARQQFDFSIAFKLDDDPIEFVCRGTVVRLDNEAGLVARYQQPQPFYERKLIEYMRRWMQV